jgi:hypothetical protein
MKRYYIVTGTELLVSFKNISRTTLHSIRISSACICAVRITTNGTANKQALVHVTDIKWKLHLRAGSTFIGDQEGSDRLSRNVGKELPLHAA